MKAKSSLRRASIPSKAVARRSTRGSTTAPAIAVHDDLKPHIGYCFYRAAGLIRAAIDQELRPFSIVAPQYGILIILKSRGAKTQGELGQCMAMDKASMVRMIDGLESKHWVRRVQSREDRRVNGLEITASGLKALAQMHEVRLRAEAQFLKPLSHEERENLAEIVGKLLKSAVTE